jgi:hypothetical protein
MPPVTNGLGRSRLVTLDASTNCRPSALLLPHVASLHRIKKLHLLHSNTSIAMALPALRHITLTNSLNSLNNCSSLWATVGSIQIVLYYQFLCFETPNWNLVRTLINSRSLRSLRFVLYDMHTTLDHRTCQIIAETVSALVDFGICFRTKYDNCTYNPESLLNEHHAFIEQLRRRICSLSLEREPYSIVEQGGCGLNVWF